MNIEKEFKNLLSKLEIVQNAPCCRLTEAIKLQEDLLIALIKIEGLIKNNKKIGS